MTQMFAFKRLETEHDQAAKVQRCEVADARFEKRYEEDKARRYGPLREEIANEIRRLREDIGVAQSGASPKHEPVALTESYLTRYRVVLVGAEQLDQGSILDRMRLRESVKPK